MAKMWMIERGLRLEHPEYGVMIAPIRGVSPTREQEDMNGGAEVALHALGYEHAPDWANEAMYLYEIEVPENVARDTTARIHNLRSEESNDGQE